MFWLFWGFIRNFINFSLWFYSPFQNYFSPRRLGKAGSVSFLRLSCFTCCLEYLAIEWHGYTIYISMQSCTESFLVSFLHILFRLWTGFLSYLTPNLFFLRKTSGLSACPSTAARLITKTNGSRFLISENWQMKIVEIWLNFGLHVRDTWKLFKSG